MVSLSEKSVIFFLFPPLKKVGGFEKLTERNDDRTGDAVGHDYSKDVHQPGIRCPELELIRLMLCRKYHINLALVILMKALYWVLILSMHNYNEMQIKCQ